MATNPYDKILKKRGLSYEDLTLEEKEFYKQGEKGTQAISLSDLKDHLDSMLYDLILEHCETPDTPESQDKNKYQKARIKNYAVLKAFMEVPDRIAKAIEREVEE